jgi:sec-independent protein translocase protein TatA
MEGNDLGGLSLTHWLVVLLVFALLFGAGKLPRLMGELASGIKNFKRSLNEDDGPEAPPAVTASAEPRRPVESR